MRELDLKELEITYKQAADVVLQKLFSECIKRLVPLHLVGQSIETEEGRRLHMRLMDIACLSILSNFIVHTVHPLGRAKFINDLEAGVNDLTNRASIQMEDGKIIVQ